MTQIDFDRSVANLRLERDAIALYEALAALERDARRAAAFRWIAGNERRHADVWAARLSSQGAAVPPPGRPRARVRAIILLARILGTHAVAGLVRSLEGGEVGVYEGQLDSAEAAAIAADERAHTQALASLPDRRSVQAHQVVRARQEGTGGGSERWHRASNAGTLRAIIFGVSDGLVSNLALVMGVAGASENDPKLILLTGIAGLLAGAGSMAAGEYISVTSQRETLEQQIALERAELEIMPEAEEQELAAIYRAKGLTADEAASFAHRLMQDPEKALDTLVREELGLDPSDLGSARAAAGGSFVAFAIGAIIPVVPFLFGGGAAVFAVAIAISLAALFAVGAGVSLVTGRSALYSGGRQVLIGMLAAGITYAVGTVIGVAAG